MAWCIRWWAADLVDWVPQPGSRRAHLPRLRIRPADHNRGRALPADWTASPPLLDALSLVVRRLQAEPGYVELGFQADSARSGSAEIGWNLWGMLPHRVG